MPDDPLPQTTQAQRQYETVADIIADRERLRSALARVRDLVRHAPGAGQAGTMAQIERVIDGALPNG